MKKRFFTVIMLAAAFALCGCNKQDLSFSGAYWNSNPQNKGVSPITEELTYSVSTTGKPEFSSAEADEGKLTLSIDGASSYYTAKLSVDGGNYVYETTLEIVGKYVYDGGEYAVTGDRTYTKTVFKGLEDRLTPISAYRQVKNVYPTKETPTSKDDFKEIGYEMTVTYGDKAEIKITPDENSKGYFSLTERTVDGYKKTTFFDEDEMIFALRAMKLTDGCNFAFDTIDGITGELKQIKAEDVSSATTSGETKQSLTPITIKNFRENERLINSVDYSAYGVAFKTTGSYGKTFKYVYYAVNTTSENTTRQVPVKIYQPLLYGEGRYLCFTLAKSAVSQ